MLSTRQRIVREAERVPPRFAHPLPLDFIHLFLGSILAASGAIERAREAFPHKRLKSNRKNNSFFYYIVEIHVSVSGISRSPIRSPTEDAHNCCSRERCIPCDCRGESLLPGVILHRCWCVSAARARRFRRHPRISSCQRPPAVPR